MRYSRYLAWGLGEFVRAKFSGQISMDQELRLWHTDSSETVWKLSFISKKSFTQFHSNPCVEFRPYEFAQTIRSTWSMCRTHMYLILVYLQDSQLTISYIWSTSKWYVNERPNISETRRGITSLFCHCETWQRNQILIVTQCPDGVNGVGPSEYKIPKLLHFSLFHLHMEKLIKNTHCSSLNTVPL